MDFYSEEEKAVCKVKIEFEGKQILSQRGCLSTKEIDEIAVNFYKDLISSPKSVFSLPKAILSTKGTPIIAIIFMDVLEKNRYEIWFTKTPPTTHPWRQGGELLECSGEYETIEYALNAAKLKIQSLYTDCN